MQLFHLIDDPKKRSAHVVAFLPLYLSFGKANVFHLATIGKGQKKSIDQIRM